jgi:hypothetical protein
MVHTYGGEPYYNIIINDLDTYGLELLEYRYGTDMFLYRELGKDIYENVSIGDGNILCDLCVKDSNGNYNVTKSGVKFSEIPFEYLDALTDRLLISNDGTYAIKIGDTYYNVAKVKEG